MNKIFYIYAITLSLPVFIFILTLKNINNNYSLIIFSLFIINQVDISFKLNVVTKYTPESKLSTKERIDVSLLILANILFLLLILLIGVYIETDMNSLTWSLIIFIFHSRLILDYSYIYSDTIIITRGQKIKFKDIKAYKIEKRFIDQIYLFITTTDGTNIHISLSQKEYETFISKNL